MALLYNATLAAAGNGFVYLYVTQNYNGGYINILNNFTWNTEGGQVDEVPYLLVKEKELNFGQVVQNITGYLDAGYTGFGSNNVQNGQVNTGSYDRNDPYAIPYSAHDTDFTYVFPHLIKSETSLRGEIKNTWGKSDIFGSTVGAAGGAVAGFLGAGKAYNKASSFLAKEAVGSGVSLEDIVLYSKTNAKTLNVTFPLYNTFSEKSAIMNYDFVNLFSLQNLKMRTSFYTIIPPKIYTIESPGQGGVYMPAAYVSYFDIKSIGTTRFMNTGQYSDQASNYQYYDSNNPGANNLGTGTAGSNGRLIPEAYRVEIHFTELIPQSSNILWGALGGQKINVTNNTTATQTGITVGLGKNGLVNFDLKPNA
jgi:hypothetical protein